MSERWYSIVEYARKFHVSDMTVRRRIKTGRLHAVLKEGKYFIPVRDGEVAARSFREPESSRGSNGNDETTHILPAEDIPLPHKPRTDLFNDSPRRLATYMPHPRYQRETPQVPASSDTNSGVPTNMQSELFQTDNSLVSTARLLNFCDSVLKKFHDLESKLEDRYQSKIHQFESNLKERDLQIAQLNQQIEDMQVLVKILEKKV